ncbi:MAG: hypothetical protein ACOY3Z_10680 [Thermodesulfobacteriota bacterium]
MLIKAEITFRLDNVAQVAQRFVALPRLPDHLELTGPFFRMEEGRRLRAMAFYRVELDRRKESEAYLRERYHAFADQPEFHLSLEAWEEYSDALKRLGIL